MTTAPQPPRPPFGTQIKYDKEGNVVVGQLWQKWRAPLSQVTVEAVDNAGAKRRATTLVFVLPTGETRRHRVPRQHADRGLAWAAAFSHWQKAVHG